MPKRISKHSLTKKGKPGPDKWIPNLKEWTDVCKLYQYDKDIMSYFDIHKETFYSFLDYQRYEKEQDRSSEFLDAYINGRHNTKKYVLGKLLKAIDRDDMAAIIFGSKTYGGLLEAKDIKHIELKKIEVAFKTKQFLSELASKFSLNYEQLDEFASKYFKDSKLDDI